MAQQLRALDALIEDRGSIPAPCSDSEPTITPVPRDLMLFSDLPKRQAYTWYTSIQVKH